MWLSIIMPIYNSEKTIEHAIRSVLDQKSQNVEVIVIDGGSTDKTMNIVNKYRDELSYVVSEQDHGYADALNKGIHHANGSYVMMLAADDVMTPNSLKNAKNSIKEETDVWCGAIISKSELGYQYEESEQNIEELEEKCSLRHPATIFRREIFEKYGYYDTSFRCVADWELFLRLKRNGAIFQIESIPMVVFSKEGMSNMNWKLLYEEDTRMVKKYKLKFMPERSIYLKMNTKPKMYSIQKLMSKWGILPYIYRVLFRQSRYLSAKEYAEILER